MRHPGEVVTRAELHRARVGLRLPRAARTWSTPTCGGSAQVVDEPFDEPLIETVRGVGYRLKAPG